jgi:DNA-directed RNA polymerase subunit RPC12/RpoP
MSTKINYQSFTITVQGMDFDCPLCGVKILSGNVHQCGTEDRPASTKPNTGWTAINGARKWHFIGLDGRSLCGRYLWLGGAELEQGNHDSPDNCTACRSRRKKQEAAR